MNLKELRAFVVVAIVSMSMFAMSGLLIPSTYAFTDCQANISSDPSGADVYIDGILRGKTPYFHFVGDPFAMDLTVEMEGYETWNEFVVVGSFERKEVHAVLTPLAGPGSPPEGAVTVTTTVTTSVTTTRSTTITTTATATTTLAVTTTSITVTSTSTATTTLVTTSAVTSSTTLTVTSKTTERASTVTSKVTEQVGMPVELTYGAIGVAVIAVIASAIIATRKRS